MKIEFWQVYLYTYQKCVLEKESRKIFNFLRWEHEVGSKEMLVFWVFFFFFFFKQFPWHSIYLFNDIQYNIQVSFLLIKPHLKLFSYGMKLCPFISFTVLRALGVNFQFRKQKNLQGIRADDYGGCCTCKNLCFTKNAVKKVSRIATNSCIFV